MRRIVIATMIALALLGGAFAEEIPDVDPAALPGPEAFQETLPAPEELSEDMPAEETQLEDLPTAEDEPLEAPFVADKETVKQAQGKLIGLGLLKGSADGIVGPKTSEAIGKFQAEAGLAVTGALDAATMNALQNAPVTVASTMDTQQRLIDLGYLRGIADGIWGKRSTAAMKLFQQLHGLNATGTPDRETTARLFSNDVTALPAALSAGDEGDAVEALQRKLIQYGFLDGSADGDYGQRTLDAVLRFQKHLLEQGFGERVELSATGEASAITQYILFSENYSSYLRDVMPGEPDSEALRVENRLKTLGYMDLPADDTLDDYALSALDLFRAKAGLGAGAADQAAIDALFTENAPVADHCAPHDIAAGDSGLAVRAVEEALLRGGMTIKLPDGSYDSDIQTAVGRLHDYLEKRDPETAALFADKAALTVEAQEALQGGLLGYVADVGGDHRNEAETTRVQRRLHALCYLAKSGVDGKFGSGSRSAVKAFQAANGLEETGVADEATQAVLFSEDAAAKPWPYRVEVSLDRQQVQVYQLNSRDEYDLVKTFECSTGLHNSTPRGIFLEGFPVNRWHYFTKFNCWAQYSFDIEGDIMFHSVIYSSNNESSLRSSSLYALGSPASHGCIRLTVDDAKWLFEHCKKGTLAIIIY